jgi:SAM-dependent methyltransferase
MTQNEIIKHNFIYYDASYEEIWKQRNILTIKDIKVPQYIYNGRVDPLDHNTAVSEYIIKSKEFFEGKIILDIGCCAGINNIILTKAGFTVIGLDNNIYSLNASLYTMKLNDTYYKVFLGDHINIPKMEYDVLIINQMDYIPEFMNEIGPIIKNERERGKFVIMTRTKR